jgi:ESCRT-I complex subunit VPS28
VIVDLFSIIKATEHLERAFVRDATTPEEYEKACHKLLSQFKMLKSSLKDQVPDVERFMVQHNMQSPLAINRLLVSGLPATVEHKPQNNTHDPEGVAIAETVQNFITAMDSLKLNMGAVDQICPILLDLVNCLSKVQQLPPHFPPKNTMKEWYSRLYQKPANYELPEEDVRQLLYELESGYNQFIATLKKRGPQ